jgi:hypothetical protein
MYLRRFVATSKLLEFLGRNSNLAGCAGAVVTMTGGMVATMNPFVSLGIGAIGYASGFLILSRSKQEVTIENALIEGKVEVETLTCNINSLKDSLAPHTGQIPPEIQTRIEDIFSTVEDILPKWDRIKGFTEEKYTINSIFTDYLPTIITNYLNLPKSYYRNAQKNQAGQEIIEQLGLLNKTLAKIRDSVYSGVEQDIRVQGIFLKQKFEEIETNLKIA